MSEQDSKRDGSPHPAGGFSWVWVHIQPGGHPSSGAVWAEPLESGAAQSSQVPAAHGVPAIQHHLRASQQPSGWRCELAHVQSWYLNPGLSFSHYARLPFSFDLRRGDKDDHGILLGHSWNLPGLACRFHPAHWGGGRVLISQLRHREIPRKKGPNTTYPCLVLGSCLVPGSCRGPAWFPGSFHVSSLPSPYPSANHWPLVSWDTKTQRG